jgi:glycosyltransferase involved in cell wall biosynthesis
MITLDVSAGVHRRAGLGRYAESLAHALYALVPDQLALFYNVEQGVTPLSGLEHLPTRTVALGYKPWRMLVWMGQLARVPFNHLVPQTEIFRANHVWHAMEHLLIPLRGIPTVLTVHDLLFHRLPEHHKFLNRWYLNWTMPLYCRRADHIIAVSQTTRRDLIHLYHIPSDKVTVIYEAADPKFHPQSQDVVESVRARHDLPERFLFYVGTIEPRKNLTRLLHAWEPLYQAGEAPPLVIGGKRGWLADDFFAALEASPCREAVMLTGYVPAADLPALYAAATAFTFPSVYEGFGLPPLEAMACGTPVACSNTPAIAEVVGDAALLFDPEDETAITEALRRVLNPKSTDLRADLRARGLRRASQFSWEQTARETLAVYTDLLS